MTKTMLSTAITLLVTASALWSQQPASNGKHAATPKVVFVCEHGSAKSVIAAAEFQRLAKQRGIPVEVVFRGTNPDPEIGVKVREGLLSDGIDIGSAKPAKVTANDLEGAARVVSFGPDLTEWLPKGVKAIDWSATPSPTANYRAARDYIANHLETLLNELQTSKSGK
jgi:arsenate reductase (thioredoxin)